jgi:hypothetical protein
MPSDASVSDESDDRQRCPVNYESSLPLILRPNAPASFYFPFILLTPPLPSHLPIRLILFKKKPSKKNYTSVKFPDPLLRFQSTITTLLTLPSHYHRLRVQFNSGSCQKYIPSHSYNTSSPLLWEITPLRSIWTRSLTGCSKVRFSSYLLGNIIYECGNCRLGIFPV